ncbi:MAG: hypothetical protein ACLUOL_03160 [Faecalibacterium sp.]
MSRRWRRGLQGGRAGPAYTDCEDFKRFGRRFFIGSGNVDSMVSHYSSQIPRPEDEYSPGSRGGARPTAAPQISPGLPRHTPTCPSSGRSGSLAPPLCPHDYWLTPSCPASPRFWRGHQLRHG